MAILRSSVLALSICLFLQVQAVDRYTDENRPYEFGFNIEGEQHRHEKKDDNGIIMGEFGFITADGIYHVTAYATDENGNFRILSTKNLRVRPSPFEQNRRQGHALEQPQQQPIPQPQAPAPASVSIEAPGQSCSHCSLPAPSPPPQDSQQNIYNNQDSQQNLYNNQYPASQNAFGEQQGSQFADNQRNEVNGEQQNEADGQQQVVQGQRDPKEFDLNAYNPQQQFVAQAEANAQFGNDQQPQYNVEQNAPQAPELIGAQLQIVDPNTDIHQLNPGEQPGLPNGVTNTDLEAVLYTFNYTVGFHGHHEEGYVNGAKKGYYYVTARDGSRTRVDYEADENGFRPRITKEVLDLISEEVPKPETEKDEKYGLKGYEFKWLYYPVDSRKQ